MKYRRNRCAIAYWVVGAMTASCAPASIVMDQGGGSADGGTGPACGSWADAGNVQNLGVGGGPPIVWPTNGSVTVSDPAACPPTPPPDPSPCSATDGQVCGYWWDDAGNPGLTTYVELGCYRNNQGSLIWSGTGNSMGAMSGCPRGAITNGSDCWGSVSLSCPNPPFETCTCPTGTTAPTWQCAPPSPPPNRPSTGPDVDASTPVATLTPAQRAAWCRWYDYVPPGYPDPPSATVGCGGYAMNTGAYFGGSFFNYACLPFRISIPQCESNLALSTCSLPVSELTDCVNSIFQSLPSPHGCGRFMSTSDCPGTIVNYKLNSSACVPIRAE
jgi:hypothetical protein